METGKKYTSTLVVEECHLAYAVGSGDLRVLATPIMLALMENAAMLCVADSLDEGYTTSSPPASGIQFLPLPS